MIKNTFLQEDGQASIVDGSGSSALGFYEEVDPFNLQAPITLNCYKASQEPIPENIEAEFDATMEELVEEIDVEEKIKKSITSTRINKGLFSTISIASNL